MPAPAGTDAGTASQLIAGVRRTQQVRPIRDLWRRTQASVYCAGGAGVLFLAALLSASCGSTPPTRSHRLPSGREVAVFHAGLAADGWHLVYRTQLPLSRELMLAHLQQFRAPIPARLQDQLQALQCEVETLVADVEAEAGSAGVRKATIAPTSTRRELIGSGGWLPDVSVSRSVDFELEQGADGVWRRAAGWVAHKCDQ
jgi:hypothetical protein